MKTTVLIGYDQSLPGEHALAVAAREAFWRGSSLTVLTAYHSPASTETQTAAVGELPADLESTARKVAEQIAQQGADRARELRPGVPVEARAVAG